MSSEDLVRIYVEKLLNDNKLSFKKEAPIPQSDLLVDYKTNGSTPLWVECKGNVALGSLFEAITRVSLAVYHEKGIGILASTHQSLEKTKKHKAFLCNLPGPLWLLNPLNVDFFSINGGATDPLGR